MHSRILNCIAELINGLPLQRCSSLVALIHRLLTEGDSNFFVESERTLLEFYIAYYTNMVHTYYDITVYINCTINKIDLQK